MMSSLDRPYFKRLNKRPQIRRMRRGYDSLDGRGLFYQFEDALRESMLYWRILRQGELKWWVLLEKERKDATSAPS